MISTCSMQFQTVDQLIEHAINVHDANIKVEHMTFDNLAQFSEFRSNEELSSNTRFVRRSRPQKNKKGNTVYTLVCHRNGPVTAHRAKGNQRLLVKTRRDTVKSIAFAQHVLQYVKQVMERWW